MLQTFFAVFCVAFRFAQMLFLWRGGKKPFSCFFKKNPWIFDGAFLRDSRKGFLLVEKSLKPTIFFLQAFFKNCPPSKNFIRTFPRKNFQEKHFFLKGSKIFTSDLGELILKNHSICGRFVIFFPSPWEGRF